MTIDKATLTETYTLLNEYKRNMDGFYAQYLTAFNEAVEFLRHNRIFTVLHNNEVIYPNMVFLSLNTIWDKEKRSLWHTIETMSITFTSDEPQAFYFNIDEVIPASFGDKQDVFLEIRNRLNDATNGIKYIIGHYTRVLHKRPIICRMRNKNDCIRITPITKVDVNMVFDDRFDFGHIFSPIVFCDGYELPLLLADVFHETWEDVYSVFTNNKLSTEEYARFLSVF